jgi:hypothetical protein
MAPRAAGARAAVRVSGSERDIGLWRGALAGRRMVDQVAALLGVGEGLRAAWFGGDRGGARGSPMRSFVAMIAGLMRLSGLAGVGSARGGGPVLGDWAYNPATRHVYAQIDGVTWADAEAYARTLHGHLVTIEDETENQWLVGHFPQPWLWIGFNDRNHDGTWSWASGRKVTYTNWQDGEPDDWKGYDPLGEPVATLTSEFDTRWADISDRYLGSGIIEVASEPVLDTRNQLPIGTHDGTTDEVAVADSCNANGWAWDPDSPKRDVMVRVLATRLDLPSVPVEVWRGRASDFRDDLLAAGFGDGTASFFVDLRPLIAYGVPYEIRAQGQDLQTGTWVSLDDTPRVVTCYPL